MPSDRAEADAVLRQPVTIAATAVMWVWHLGNDLPSAITTWHRFRPPMVDLAALVVLGGVGLVATWWLWRPERVGNRAVLPWTLGAILLVTEAVTLAACPVEDRFGAANWIWGAVGWFAIPVFWHRRRLTDLLVFLGLHVALCGAVFAASAAAEPAALGRFLVVQYATTSLQLAFAVGSRATGAAAGWATAAAAATAAVAAGRAAAVAVEQNRRQRYQTIRESTREVLAGLASGTLDPSDPAVRRRCAIEAAKLRRLLAEDDDVPEPLLHELRACADVAERRGVQIEIVAVGEVPDLPPATRRRLAEPPIAVLAGTRSRARITVAALPDDVAVSVLADCEPSDVVGVVGPPAAPPLGGVPGRNLVDRWHACEPGRALRARSAADGQVEVAHHREGALLWTQTRWRSRSGSPSSTTTRW